MMITIANLKGDDRKTRGRMGNRLTLELSIWGGVVSGAITSMSSFCNLVIEYEDYSTERDI